MTLNRENVLIEALPYIREFHESIMVIKVGGHAMVNPEVMSDIIQDLVLLRFVGIHPIIVHGGGPEISEKMKRMGKESQFVGGLRVTDDETLEIARMVLVGNINTEIVALIGKHGGKGVGLSGKDGKTIIAKKKPSQKVMIENVEHEVDLGWVGDTEIINTELLNILIREGYIPVISPIAMDINGKALNINADTVAGDIAAALKAKKLILMTDVPGLLRDINDRSSRISRVAIEDIDDMVDSGLISGGMIPKMRSAATSSVSHSILLELFTDTGIGTMVFKKGDE